MTTQQTGRVIGVRHRVKKTAEGEARPTELFIRKVNGKAVKYELPDDDAELDFVLDRFPTSWREITESDQVGEFPSHHIKWKKLGTEEDPLSFPEHQVRKVGKSFFRAHKVPQSYDGLKPGDKIVMILGGSGDRFAFALTNRGQKIGAQVFRIPTFVFKNERTGDRDNTDDDARILTEVFSSKPRLFYPVRKRDANLIMVREALRARNDAMKARIGCEQRLRQRVIGEVFLSEEGQFPEGSIEAAFDKKKASDRIFRVLLAEEREAERVLIQACERLDVFKELFGPIEGVGPMIASRIISAITDIRMFGSKPRLKAFMGAHVLSDGRFARRRAGEVANWHPDARQALYLLADQFNRRPGSKWGKKLLEYKAVLRTKHPTVEVIDGKSRYTDGHIHKMAMWRTSTKFVEWLYREWWKLEGGKNPSPSPTPAPVAIMV